jgi:hypothetical protein
MKSMGPNGVPFPPNEVGRIAEHAAREMEGKNESCRYIIRLLMKA